MRRMHLAAAVLAGLALLPIAPVPAGASTPSATCIGDGTSGKRLQAVYAYYAADGIDTTQRDLIHPQTAVIEDAFEASAERSAPGAVARPRWVCTPSVVSIQNQVLPADWDGTISDLAASMTLTNLNRQYVVWVDAPVPSGKSSCVSNGVWDDDDPSPALNFNNGNNGVVAPVAMIGKRADSDGCWQTDFSGSSFSWGMQHEVMHNLGAVQRSAPHVVGQVHTYDGYDVMYLKKKGKIRRCRNFARDMVLFDCKHDDYFSANPACRGYLSKHWNTYNSSFLTRGTTPPQTCGIRGPARTRDTTPNYLIRANRPSTFTCKIDDGPAAVCTSPFTTPTQDLGPHVLTVQATDLDGNVDPTPAVRSFRIIR